MAACGIMTGTAAVTCCLGSMAGLLPGAPIERRMSRPREAPVLNDLAALTPPLLVCVAFLVAVAAFVRHEMRHADSPPSDEQVDVSARDRNLDHPSLNPNASSRTASGREATRADREDGTAAPSEG